MEGKTTCDLGQELMLHPNLDEYISDNEEEFSSTNVAELLTELYSRNPISKTILARQVGMSTVYLHQIFCGRRTPSRDRLLCICIGMELTLEDTQCLLKRTAYAPLYPRLKRDAIISHGLLFRKKLTEINDKLFLENEKPLC